MRALLITAAALLILATSAALSIGLDIDGDLVRQAAAKENQVLMQAQWL